MPSSRRRRTPYRAARRQLLDDALLVAQRAARAAVACLLRNGKPSAEIRATEALLGHVARGQELTDLAHDIEELKRQVGCQSGR